MRLTETTPVWARWLLALSLLFNLGFLTAFSVRWACSHWRGGEKTSAGDCPLYEQLRLEPGQRARAEQEKKRLMQDVRRLQHRLAGEREALMTLLLSPEPDSAAVDRRLARICETQAAVQRRVVDHFLAERRELSPAQRQAFQEVIRGWVCPRVGGGTIGDACAPGCGDRPPAAGPAPETAPAARKSDSTSQ
jgi:uncharacterized membrane protein